VTLMMNRNRLPRIVGAFSPELALQLSRAWRLIHASGAALDRQDRQLARSQRALDASHVHIASSRELLTMLEADSKIKKGTPATGVPSHNGRI